MTVIKPSFGDYRSSGWPRNEWWRFHGRAKKIYISQDANLKVCVDFQGRSRLDSNLSISLLRLCIQIKNVPWKENYSRDCVRVQAESDASFCFKIGLLIGQSVVGFSLQTFISWNLHHFLLNLNHLQSNCECGQQQHFIGDAAGPGYNLKLNVKKKKFHVQD